MGTTVILLTESEPQLAGTEQVKHTPGPWRIAGEATIRAGHAGWIGRVHWRNREPNARLIAAAPDLLAALKLTAAVVENIAASDEHYEMVKAAQAAIAKAEGRTP